MLRKILALFPLIALCCFALRPLWADCAELQPILKPDGTKWRIGYYEGGAYNDYVPVTKAALARLAKLGWLPDAAMRCVDGAKDSSGLWACLSDNPGDYLEFPKDARWSANWEDERRAANRADFIKRARERHDLDLVFALGTWAGQDLASDEHDIPVVVCSTSNAIASGIIKSAEDPDSTMSTPGWTPRATRGRSGFSTKSWDFPSSAWFLRIPRKEEPTRAWTRSNPWPRSWASP